MEENERYSPALSFSRLTPLFDPVIRWSMRELELKHRLIKQARIEPGYSPSHHREQTPDPQRNLSRTPTWR